MRRGMVGLVGFAQFLEGVSNQTSGTLAGPGLVGVPGMVLAIGQVIVGVGLRHEEVISNKRGDNKKSDEENDEEEEEEEDGRVRQASCADIHPGHQSTPPWLGAYRTPYCICTR